MENKFNMRPPDLVARGRAQSDAKEPAAEPTMWQRIFEAGQSTAQGPRRAPGSASSSSSVGSSPAVRRLGEDTLRALSGGLPLGRKEEDLESDGSGGIADRRGEVVTEGELRHFRKQMHLERKRSAFLKDKARPDQQQQQGGRWESESVNSDAASDDGESEAPQRSSAKSVPVQPGEAVVIDIASMKKLYAGRLGLTNTAAAAAARKAEVTPIASSENTQRLWPSLPGQKSRRQTGYDSNKVGTVVREVAVPDSGLSLRELASKLSMKIDAVRKKLEELGESFDDLDSGASYSSRQRRGAGRKADGSSSEAAAEDKHIDADVAELLVLELGLSSTRVKAPREISATARRAYSAEPSADQTDGREKKAALPPRYPIVCIMGHVDHGKTPYACACAYACAVPPGCCCCGGDMKCRPRLCCSDVP